MALTRIEEAIPPVTDRGSFEMSDPSPFVHAQRDHQLKLLADSLDRAAPEASLTLLGFEALFTKTTLAGCYLLIAREPGKTRYFLAVDDPMECGLNMRYCVAWLCLDTSQVHAPSAQLVTTWELYALTELMAQLRRDSAGGVALEKK